MYHKIFSRLKRNLFLRHVSILASGTVVGQAILLLSTPVLTRLFSPSDFGLLALFTSISTIAAILTTGRYELAIVLPEKENDAINVLGLVGCLGAIVSVIYLLIIVLLRQAEVSISGQNNFFYSPIVYLIPLFTFIAASNSALQYWNLREKNYKKLTISNILQVLSATGFNFVMGFMAYKKFGLIFGLLFGQIVATLWLLYFLSKTGAVKNITFNEIKLKAKQFFSFPKYMIVSDLSTTTSQQIIPVLFSVLFNSTIVGFYSLANRMLKVPAIVLTSSISSVFRNDAIHSLRKTGSCKFLFISTFKKLVIISAPIYILIGLCSPFLFSIIFGKGWINAGYFAQVICFSLIFDFIATPFNSLFYIIHKQKIYMNIQVFKTLVNIAFIFIGFYVTHNSYYTVLFFALSDASFSMITLYTIYKLSSREYQKHTDRIPAPSEF